MGTNVLSIGVLSNDRPQVIAPYNNGLGTFLYNHNIIEVDVVRDEVGGIILTDDPEKATGKMFQYDSLRMEEPMTGDHIFSTLLTAKYPANTESKLINEYQSALMGLLDKSAKKPYEAFLKDRIAIRDMVDRDCAAFNIPIDV